MDRNPSFLKPPPPPPPSQHGISHPGIISLGGCRSVRLFLGLSIHTLTSFYNHMKLRPSEAQSVFPGVSHKTASSFNETELLAHLAQRAGLPVLT